MLTEWAGGAGDGLTSKVSLGHRASEQPLAGRSPEQWSQRACLMTEVGLL